MLEGEYNISMKISEHANDEHRLKISPCVGNCCLDLDDICLGCYRSMQEILDWHQADEAQRKQILMRCDVRQKLCEQRNDQTESQ